MRQLTRDERDQITRETLEKIRDKGLVETAARLELAIELALHYDFGGGERGRGVRDFLSDKKGSGKQHADAIFEFVYRTRLGRALTHPGSQPVHPYERVLEPLISGAGDAPSQTDFCGQWLVYHGSYKISGHVAVHLIKVKEDEAGILSVTDHIMESQIAGVPVDRDSLGCLTFVQGQVQILTSGHENRMGFSLFVGTPSVNANTRKPLSIVGDLFGMTDNNLRFTRKALLLPMEPLRKDVIEMTGIFAAKDFEKGGRAYAHREAFGHLQSLARNNIGSVEADPILTLDFTHRNTA